MSNLIPLENEYIAGFFDGEGSCSIRRENLLRGGRLGYRLILSIFNKHEEVLKQIQSQCGGTLHLDKRNDCFKLNIARASDIEAFIDRIEPHSVIKVVQLELAKAFLEELGDKEWYWQEMSRLNRNLS